MDDSTQTLDCISVVGVTETGRHGVNASERVHGQPFIVDVYIYLDLSQAASTDQIDKTCDYAHIAQLVSNRIKGEPSNLIETLAMAIITDIFAETEAQIVRVKVDKPNAPIAIPFGTVAVTLVRTREQVSASAAT